MWHKHKSDDDPLTVLKPVEQGSFGLGIDWKSIPGGRVFSREEEFLERLVCSIYPFAAEYSPSASMHEDTASPPPQSREFWLTVFSRHGRDGKRAWLWLCQHRPSGGARLDRLDDRDAWDDIDMSQLNLEETGLLELVQHDRGGDLHGDVQIDLYVFTQAFVDLLQGWWNREIVKRPE
jgi:hypothetical protein